MWFCLALFAFFARKRLGFSTHYPSHFAVETIFRAYPFVSNSSVTGPSLTSSTSIIVRNTPVSTA